MLEEIGIDDWSLIKMDFKAVRNTIKYNVTNGVTEGFVNKQTQIYLHAK